MMQREEEFVVARRPDWDELDRLLRATKRRHAPQITRLAALYRAVCADLMRARTAGYGADLVAALDGLAGRAHNQFYEAPPTRLSAVVSLFTRDFPRALRKQAGFFAFAAALFLVPGAIGYVGAVQSRAFAVRILPESQLGGVEAAYATETTREDGGDTQMAGFYVYNNVGIAFRCFATGILFGLGSVFFLVYNGLVIGTVAGAVAGTGHLRNLLTFTCGHSSFELTAIIIAGAAGMQMGYALVNTGSLGRWASLRAQSKSIAHLVFGAAGMLLIAAAIEGFWSASPVPAQVKWAVAGVLALLVTTYFVFAGRKR